MKSGATVDYDGSEIVIRKLEKAPLRRRASCAG
jgi:hypothetical protein